MRALLVPRPGMRDSFVEAAAKTLGMFPFFCYMFGLCKRIAPAFSAIFEDDINLLRRIPT